MKAIFVVVFCVLTAVAYLIAADAPPPEAFQILPAVEKEGPVITPYLRYQTEMGWRQDDARRAGVAGNPHGRGLGARAAQDRRKSVGNAWWSPHRADAFEPANHRQDMRWTGFTSRS